MELTKEQQAALERYKLFEPYVRNKEIYKILLEENKPFAINAGHRIIIRLFAFNPDLKGKGKITREMIEDAGKEMERLKMGTLPDIVNMIIEETYIEHKDYLIHQNDPDVVARNEEYEKNWKTMVID